MRVLCNAKKSIALHQNCCYIYAEWDVKGLRATELARGYQVKITKQRRTGAKGEGPSQRMTAMPEATTQTTKPKSKQPFAAFPGVEAPAAFRDMAEKSLSQAKDSYEKMKSAAEEATGVLEDTYATASKGAADYTLKIIEMARENSNAAFDFAVELLGAKTFSEFVELSSAHARKQFEAMSEQTKELATLAQKVATEAVEPLKEGMTKAAKKAA